MHEKTTIQEIIAQKESEWVDEKLKEIEHLRIEINNIMKKEELDKFKELLEKFEKYEDDTFAKLKFLSEHKFEIERSATYMVYEAYRECRLQLQWLLDDMVESYED